MSETTLIWRRSHYYVDRRGFEYMCVDITPYYVVLRAYREDGSVTLAARMRSGTYHETGEEHDYDIVKERSLT